ncbi:MAG: hypothetical protein K2K04_02110 [Clostridia bacterium]|nr:hypothetical protein [Clostridia bacterium]
MSKKALFLAVGGVCAAGLLCFFVGLIVYLTNKGNAIPVIISLFAMSAGAIIAAASAIILLVTLIITLITKSKNR